MWGWRPVSGKKMESKDFDAKQKKKILAHKLFVLYS
jgi:hypothetical protein